MQLPAASTSAFFQMHRVGESARLLNMYQNDYMRRYLRDHMREADLMGGMIAALARSVEELVAAVGAPLRADGSRRALVVLVANNGVMDFVLNFACSCRAAGLDTGDVVVYVGSREGVALVRAMGLRALFSPGLGGMPDAAASNYGDDSFGSMVVYRAVQYRV